ncbi:MAG: tyrosine-type recombinase/integrase [Phormidesmis sp.]
MAEQRRKRGRRGGVNVSTRDDILRLRWTYAGRRQQISLYLPDIPVNRQLAEEKARQIERDIATGDYDPTLEKYKIHPPAISSPSDRPPTVTLFDWFTEEKAIDGVSGQSISTKYRALRANIARLGRDILTVTDARELVQLLRDRQSPLIANQNLVMLKTFGKWLVKHRYIAKNVFEPIRPKKGSALRVQNRTPFSREELSQFLETMRNHPTAAHYYDFTVVLFSLGLRPSEAIGLRWQHINLGRRKITIGESLSRSPDGRTSGRARQRKGTKSGNVRILPMNDRLCDLFRCRWHSDAEPDELIFTAVNGKPIDDHNYRERYWKPVCEAAGIPYRPPYTARHTLLSYGIEYEGWTLSQAAFIAGHTTTRMVSDTYGHLMDVPNLPDLGE